MKTKLFNRQPASDKFSGKVGLNPEARKYKENNIQAIRTLYEIADKHGNIDDPEFDEAVKELLSKDYFGYKSAENSDRLGKSLKNFIKAWPEIEENDLLCADITTMLGGFYNGWDDYVKAKECYGENEQYPVYLDVADYLESLVDEDGKLKANAEKTQSEYSRLAISWKAEIRKEYQHRLALEKGETEQ